MCLVFWNILRLSLVINIRAQTENLKQKLSVEERLFGQSCFEINVYRKDAPPLYIW